MQPRQLRRLLLVSSLLIALPPILSSMGCRRAEDASDYDDEDDAPRRGDRRLPKLHAPEEGQPSLDTSGPERSGGGRTFYCAPGDVTACFETPAKCQDRAKYLPGQPACVTQEGAYCYTHDLYLNETHACFATMQDCAGDQSIAKRQEEANQGTYYNVSPCRAW